VGMTTISSQKPIVSVNARNALNYTIFASSGAGGGRAEVQVLVFHQGGQIDVFLNHTLFLMFFLRRFCIIVTRQTYGRTDSLKKLRGRI